MKHDGDEEFEVTLIFVGGGRGIFGVRKIFFFIDSLPASFKLEIATVAHGSYELSCGVVVVTTFTGLFRKRTPAIFTFHSLFEFFLLVTSEGKHFRYSSPQCKLS